MGMSTEDNIECLVDLQPIKKEDGRLYVALRRISDLTQLNCDSLGGKVLNAQRADKVYTTKVGRLKYVEAAGLADVLRSMNPNKFHHTVDKELVSTVIDRLEQLQGTEESLLHRISAGNEKPLPTNKTASIPAIQPEKLPNKVKMTQKTVETTENWWKDAPVAFRSLLVLAALMLVASSVFILVSPVISVDMPDHWINNPVFPVSVMVVTLLASMSVMSKGLTLSGVLDWFSIGVSVILGSFFMLISFFIGSIAAEAYIQASLIQKVMGFPMELTFLFMFSVLMSIVYVSINEKYVKEYLQIWWRKEIKDGKDKEGKAIFRYPRLRTFTIIMWVYFIYNITMSEMRAFHGYGGGFWTIEGILRCLVGAIIPINISVLGNLVNKRLRAEYRKPQIR